MAEDVTIGIAVRNADQHREFLRLKEEAAGLRAELAKVGAAGKKSGQDAGAGFKDMGQAAAQLATRFVGVGAAIGGIMKYAQLVKAEYDQLLQRQQDANNAQVDINPSFQRAAATMPGLDPDTLYRQVIAQAAGKNPAAIFGAIEAGSAARGNQSEQSVVDTAIAAARMGKGYEDQTLNSWTAAALENSKTFGGSPEENLAMTREVFLASRTKDPQAAFKNMLPIIPQMANLAGGKKDFGLMASHAIGIGGAMGDAEGGSGGTAAIQLVRQVVAEALMSGKATMGDDYEKKLDIVRNDPKIQKKLLGVFAESMGTSVGDLGKASKSGKGGLAIESKAFAAAVGYLSSNQDPATNLTAAEIAAARGKLNTPQVALENLKAQNERMSRAGPGPTAEVARADAQLENERKLGDTAEGKKGALLNFYDNRMKDMRIFQADRTFAKTLAHGLDGTPEEMTQRIRTGLRGQAQKNITTGFASPASLDASKEIMKQTETLEKMLEWMKTGNGTQKVEVVNGKTNQPAKSPAEGLGK